VNNQHRERVQKPLTAQDDTARPVDVAGDEAASGAIDNLATTQTTVDTKPEVAASFRIALVVLKSDWTTLPNWPAMEKEVNRVLPVNVAAIQVQRAEELRRLHEQIENDEPLLNPETFEK